MPGQMLHIFQWYALRQQVRNGRHAKRVCRELHRHSGAAQSPSDHPRDIDIAERGFIQMPAPPDDGTEEGGVLGLGLPIKQTEIVEQRLL